MTDEIFQKGETEVPMNAKNHWSHTAAPWKLFCFTSLVFVYAVLAVFTGLPGWLILALIGLDALTVISGLGYKGMFSYAKRKIVNLFTRGDRGTIKRRHHL